MAKPIKRISKQRFRLKRKGENLRRQQAQAQAKSNPYSKEQNRNFFSSFLSLAYPLRAGAQSVHSSDKIKIIHILPLFYNFNIITEGCQYTLNEQQKYACKLQHRTRYIEKVPDGMKIFYPFTEGVKDYAESIRKPAE